MENAASLQSQSSRHNPQEDLFSLDEVRAFACSAGATLLMLMLVLDLFLCLFVVFFIVYLFMGAWMDITSPGFVYDGFAFPLQCATALLSMVILSGGMGMRYSLSQCRDFRKPAIIGVRMEKGQYPTARLFINQHSIGN
jgi:hypothetical protein